MVSDLSEVDCDRALDDEQGYFETWPIFADEHATVALEVKSEFDSLLRLVRVVAVDGDQLTTELVAENDDRAMDDPTARVSATLTKADNYLLRVSGFADEDTGPYTVVATPNDAPEPQPKTGSIEVRVEETLHPLAGYTVTLNGSKPKRVAGNAKTEYDGLVEGTYAVTLTDVGECTVDGADTQNVAVSANQTSAATFRVTCNPVGTLRIVTMTTGVDIDHLYDVRFGKGEEDIGSNESFDVPDVPIGDYSVVLTGVAANCDVVSGDIRDVTVLADSVTTVNFTIECRDRDSPRIRSVDIRETLHGGCDFTEYAFEYTIHFVDCNGLTSCEGDVTVAESTVDFYFTWENGEERYYTSDDPDFHVLAGQPVEGAFHVVGCLGFFPFTEWVDATITLKDAAGLASNPFTVRIENPGE
jgi:hypothetical protein